MLDIIDFINKQKKTTMNTNNATIKLNSTAILKMLPKGFTAVKIPEKTRVVYIEAEASIINLNDATAAIKSLAKKLKLIVDRSSSNEEYHHFVLEDPAFNKAMRAQAKICLKAVKDFYKKYGIAYRYDDDTCDTMRHVIRKVNNDE